MNGSRLLSELSTLTKQPFSVSLPRGLPSLIGAYRSKISFSTEDIIMVISQATMSANNK